MVHFCFHSLSESHIDENATKELEVLQKINPGLSIVYKTAFSHQHPGTKKGRMAYLLSLVLYSYLQTNISQCRNGVEYFCDAPLRGWTCFAVKHCYILSSLVDKYLTL